jgi:hypothetical protein
LALRDKSSALARSTRDRLNILDTIAKAGAGFKSLGDTWESRGPSRGGGAGRGAFGMADGDRHRQIFSRCRRYLAGN